MNLDNLLKGNKGIPRKDMPQLDDAEKRRFFTHAKSMAISCVVPAFALKPVQNELDEKKVRSFQSIEGLPPILISNDYYIVDGHHRWAAEYVRDPNTPIECLQSSKSIDEILSFFKVMRKSASKSTSNKADSSSRKLEKKALKIAESLYDRDRDSSRFLSEYARRSKSLEASLLVEQMKGLGPKFASKSLLGFQKSTVRRCLDACVEIRIEAGDIAFDLSERDDADRIRECLSAMRSKASKMLCQSFP